MSVYKNENLVTEMLKSFGDWGEIETNNISYEKLFGDWGENERDKT